MMVRNLLPILLLMTVFVFGVQAQKKTPEEKAVEKAEIIVKYINSKITDEAGKVTDEQQEKVKQAYMEYYADKSAYKKRKKKFMAEYKEWKAATASPVDAETKAKLEAQKGEIAKENKALNKESKEMKTRREDKIKEALNEEQTTIFEAMRAEQAAKKD